MFKRLESSIISVTNGQRLLQIAIAVLLLTISALLIANICLIDLARNFNTRVCVKAAQVGALTAVQGGNHQQVMQAVQRTVMESSPGGYFVLRPKLDKLRFDSVKGFPCLVVGTVTGARVPAPMLVWNGTFGIDGRLLFYRTCIVSLKPGQKLKQI
jgi:hypothetical protein